MLIRSLNELLDSFRMVIRKIYPVIKRQGTLGQPDLWEEEGTGNLIQSHSQWFNQSCLHDKTPIKSLDAKTQWKSVVGEHIDGPRG